jgi:pyrimidine-specific ribonucleoside hydrolase
MTRTIRFLAAVCLFAAALSAQRGPIPLVQTTDLYHPPMDPDDHVDLATALALTEFDLRAVIFDADARMIEGTFAPGDLPREPGFVPVAQIAYLAGRAIPAAIGPLAPLRSPSDTALDRPRREQAGVELLLRVLRESPEPVVVTVLGSARIVTAAWNREPALMERKVRRVVLNAGTAAGPANEYNVKIDPHAYVGLLRSRLPVDWYPCASTDGTFSSPGEAAGEHNTFWRAPHAELFRGLPAPLTAWFVHAFAGNGRGDVLRALREENRGSGVAILRSGERNLWCTASYALAAGRRLVQTPEGWRFVPGSQAPAGAPEETLALDPVSIRVNDAGVTEWTPGPAASRQRLFRRTPGPRHTAGMTAALNALLRSLPLE